MTFTDKKTRKRIADKKYREANKEKAAAYMAIYREENREAAAAYNREYRQSPVGKFQKHKSHAKERGIGFLLTFAEWWAIWEPHWEHRGNKTGDGLVMCRTGDVGPYAVGNVRIDTNSNNVKEARELQKI